MADIVTTSFLAPVASRFAVTGTGKLSPSALELGAETLTRNPAREAIARLFSPANNAGLLARLDTLLAAQQSQTPANANTLRSSLKSSTGLRAPAQNGDLINGLFSRTETGAALRLKELLNAAPRSAAAPPSAPVADLQKPVEIKTNNSLRVAEGGAAVISSLRLQSASSARARDIVYTLDEDNGLRHGSLEFIAKPGEEVTSFTQEDVDLGRLRYVNDGSEFTTDSFRFGVSDGKTEAQGSFSIQVRAVNDAPTVVSVAGANVDEGGGVTLASNAIVGRDVDSRNADLVYTVTRGPEFGRLELAGDPGVAVTSFTQGDLAAGRVRYVNDGSEETADSFTFRISDGSASSATSSFAISINPVDDTPEPFVNTGAVVEEGGATAITSVELSLVDVDTTPEDLTYTVTAGPAHGRLEFTDNAGVAVTSFTQQDVDSGRLQYVHDGSEEAADSFSFEVADLTNTLQVATFNLAVTPVDDAPVSQPTGGLTAAEGGAATIGAGQLGVSDVDTAAGDLAYTVTTGPSHGRLEFSDAAGVAVTSFTQADIDSGRLRYVHDGSETTADSFSFTAADATTDLAEQAVAITVTPVNDAPTLVNTGATVAENGTHTVTLSELRGTDPDTASSQLVYTVTGTTNGRLESSTNPGVALATFTQDDIAAGRVRFVQNGAESSSAGFTFSLSDGNTTLAGNSFNFNVTPVNDTPFSSTNTGASVARRSTTIITASSLRYSDPDNTSAQLTYTIASPVSRGRLELTTNPGVSITSFTQADIDAGLVRYVHTANGGAND
ncbi:MAG TPA: cadherin-like domain-containing protein, partial [Patescibacteria group bacterium]|nr:cadherin-like domain-containing protein [Patescibacteria group bacterium]